MSAPEHTNWHTPVQVTLWDALASVRYGLGRQTPANSDAASLARKIWPLLDQSIRNQIREDAARITGFDAEPWAWLNDEETPLFGKDALPKGGVFGKPTTQEGGGSGGSDLPEGEGSTVNDSKDLTVEHDDEATRMTDAEFEAHIRGRKF